MSKLTFNSTFLRVMAPTVFILCVLAVAMAGFSYWQAKNLYQDLQETSLKSFLNTSRNVLASSLPPLNGETPPPTQAIREALVQTSLPQDIGLFVFSPSGKVLYQKGIGSEALIKNHMGYFLKQGDSASHSLITPQGETIVGMHMPSRDVFLAIYSQNTFASMPQSQNIKTQVLVVVPLAIMAAILLLFITLHYSIFQPLVRLASGMRDIIERKAFASKIPERGSEEIKELSGYFNQMASALKKRDKALKAYSDSLEAQVKERTKDLEDTQQRLVMHERLAAIGEFASSIVHELRNPLSAIKMGIERLNMQAKSEKNKRSLELSKQEVNRLDNMLRGILDFAANRPTNIEPVPIKDILARMEPFICAEEETHKVTFTRPRPKNTAVALADSTKLEQALLNVVKNAAEYAPEGSAITLKCAEDKGTVRLEVTNEGAPIPDSIKSRLFEPFYTTKKRGTGLGLPTSKKLMDEMDGTIAIKSDKAGVTVTLTLPKA